MICFKEGSLLNDNVEALVNTVNCVGVMGRGIALQFKKKYPENFKDYSIACRDKKIKTGTMLVHRTESLMNPKFIINFPTKDHWRGKSQLSYIENGLIDLVKIIKELNPNKMIQLLPGAYSKASSYLQNHKDTQSNFNKVADLVEGFESSYGLELLSTVHWVIKNNNLNSFEDLVKTTYEWNDRKKRFTVNQIKTAYTILYDKNWLSKSFILE
ncbi:hypothetical protein EW093_13100 [Thiospirochaeta perfilievii]|uniref:Macro domain-containing protein n=2 Tax=Thiospirochaeta perfilievii TaxID=252967 RepID=A0A5C1QEA3_9SPIO|nr:hypothetical protein EW093_13100 [Thiospirochaeta perfilievii]